MSLKYTVGASHRFDTHLRCGNPEQSDAMPGALLAAVGATSRYST